VATILFDNGSSKLKSRDKRILSAVMRLQRKNGGQVRVIGHASSRTRNLTPINHKMTNFEVSASRADRVAGELMRLGVNKKDILIAAVSDADPAYYEIMPSGEAGNRRTEIYIVN
jgi:flagellar motor protein MotB